MAHCGRSRKASLHCISYRLSLACCWCLGFILGVWLFLHTGTPGISLMRRTVYSSVSIVSLICICLLPFLFTVYAVFISELRLLFLICFCKACLFGFASVSDFVKQLSEFVPGRLLVLFPGEYSDNTYRLLDARDGWGYQATAITAEN